METFDDELGPMHVEAIWVEKGEHAGAWVEEELWVKNRWKLTDETQFRIRIAWAVFPNKPVVQPAPPIKTATPDQWKFLTGLVVCGLATKVNV